MKLVNPYYGVCVPTILMALKFRHCFTMVHLDNNHPIFSAPDILAQQCLVKDRNVILVGTDNGSENHKLVEEQDSNDEHKSEESD